MVKVLRLFFYSGDLQQITKYKLYQVLRYHTKFYEVYQNQYFALLVIIKE